MKLSQVILVGSLLGAMGCEDAEHNAARSPAQPAATVTGRQIATAPSRIGWPQEVFRVGSLDEMSPRGRYLEVMHRRLHPMFAEQLDAMAPATRSSLPNVSYAVAEIVVERPTGAILRRGLIKVSGSVAFDVAVLKAIDAAAPFGPAPEELVSSDGLVPIQWQFHPNHVDPCSPRNARFIMKPTPTL